jgi:hypothetical protein
VGTKRTFYVSTDLQALITIYFDGVLVLSTTGTSAHYPTDGDGITGTLGAHIIEAVATNACGWSNTTCTWTVYDPNPQPIFTPPNTQSVVQIKRWSISDTYGHSFEETLRTLCEARYTYQKCQLPDGNWIYQFNMGLIGLVRDASTGLKPTLITGVSGAPSFLGGFYQFKIDMTKNDPSYNNPNLTLFSSLDPYCFGVSNLLGGDLTGFKYSTEANNILTTICGDLLSLAEGPIDTFITAGQLLTDLCGVSLDALKLLTQTPTDVEQISQKFDFASPQTDVSCYVRWIVFVKTNTTVLFNVEAQLLQNAPLEIKNNITITSGQDPIINEGNS